MNRFLFVMGLLTATTCFAQQTTTPTSQTVSTRSPFRTIAHTEYTPHSELFAEYRPLLLQTAGRFTAHLTQIGEPFKPYTNAEVTLTLIIGGKTAYQASQTQPAAPGIYRFPIKPEMTGTGTITIELKMPAYTERFTLDKVTVYADETAALAAGMGRTNERTVPGEIAYYKEKSWLEIFATAPVTVTKKAVSIPQTAVLSEEGTSYVYVQNDPEHFRKQVVQTGKRTGALIEVTNGLKPDDRIVTLGADKIK